MRLYRIDWYDSEPTAQTADWATSKVAAARIARESGDPDARVTELDVEMTKAGILALLKEWVWCDAGRAIARALDQ